MKAQVQIALVIVALLYLAWGLALLLAPEQAHALLSTGPYNATTSAMFGAALFAFVTIFFIAAHEPMREIVHASAVGLAFFGVVAAYQMLVANTMPQSPPTVISLMINLAVAVYLLMSLTYAAVEMQGASRKGAPGKKVAARRRG
jgi:hypothetical protein